MRPPRLMRSVEIPFFFLMSSSDADLEPLAAPPNSDATHGHIYGYTLKSPSALDEHAYAIELLRMIELPILEAKPLAMHAIDKTPVLYLAVYSPRQGCVRGILSGDDRIPGQADRRTIEEQLGEQWAGPRWFPDDGSLFDVKNTIDLVYQACKSPQQRKTSPFALVQ
ncbi:hypothetical protein MKEN_00606200 [Mycena kentingensis (nom. inval.)]|nr:hypothetical protein MKEN_00606200 [Mycena kentingensis (nom. inval.)]